MRQVLNISNGGGSASGVVVEAYDRAGGGKADVLTATYFLARPGDVTQLAVAPASYLVLRVPTADEAAKSIDNWVQAPQPGQSA